MSSLARLEKLSREAQALCRCLYDRLDAQLIVDDRLHDVADAALRRMMRRSGAYQRAVTASVEQSLREINAELAPISRALRGIR